MSVFVLQEPSGSILGIRVMGQMSVAHTSWLGLNFSFKMFSLKGDQSYSFWKTHCRRTATWNLVASYNKIKVAITYQIWRHLCLLLDEFLTLLAQLLFSLFPLLKTQYNVLARGLTPLSLEKCWSLAYNYKGDNKQAVNN